MTSPRAERRTAVLHGHVSVRPTSRRVGDFILGSWTRTAAAALLFLALFLGLTWLAASGRLADLRYASIPMVRPWPPTGYYINPLNPSHDRGDLVNAAEASRVKADLLRDGQIELQAVETGNPSLL